MANQPLKISQSAVETAERAVKELGEAIAGAVRKLGTLGSQFLEFVKYHFKRTNPRVVHLAKVARKARTRKKNRKRISESIERG